MYAVTRKPLPGTGLIHFCFVAVMTAIVAASPLTAVPALAQDGTQDPAVRNYPSRPIKLIVAYTVGGGTDIMARLAAKELSQAFGQPVVVENRAGTLAIAGTEAGARAAPDGYTLLATPSGPMTMNPIVRAQLPYSPTRDFAAISVMGKLPFLLAVNASLPVRNLKELIDYARARPNEVSYGASGPLFQLGVELLKQKTGTQFLHIPYKSSGDGVAALLSNQVTMVLLDTPPLSGPVKSGRLRALAFANDKRSASFPDVPTTTESGFEGMEVYTWVGMMAPAGTPSGILRKLEIELIRISKLPEVRERFQALGVEPMGTSAEEFRRIIADETQRWSAVAKASGIKPE